VLSVATQSSWKNAQDECSSKTERHRIVPFRPRLAEHVLATVQKGAHVFVEGELVSSTYERPNGKGKKSATTKITSRSIRADVVRKLDRGEPQPETAPVAEAAARNAVLRRLSFRASRRCREALFLRTVLAGMPAKLRKRNTSRSFLLTMGTRRMPSPASPRKAHTAEPVPRSVAVLPSLETGHEREAELPLPPLPD
jgi:single-stranded DNA-binding protein